MARETPEPPSNRPLKVDLRAVVFPDGDLWIAHCLEMDIVAQGETPEQATSDLAELCAFQLAAALEEHSLESAFRPAPPGVWSMFAQSAESKTPSLPRKRVGAWRALNSFDVRTYSWA